MSVTTQDVAPPPSNGHSTLSPSITGVLTTLRSRIRAYVWMQGLALVLAWLGMAFWISLAIDWIPVPFGNDEPGFAVRLIILISALAMMTYIFYRYVLRRARVPLRDRNMAILLERRFREFDDSLLTAVELTAEPGHAANFNRDMLDRTCKIAVDHTGRVQVNQVLNPGPRMLAIVLAIVFVGSVGTFAVAAPNAFSIWLNRAILLGDDLWPRRNHIALEGPRLVKVPRGEDYTIRVIADTENGKILPRNVRMDYVNEDGVESSINLNRHVEQDGTQLFSHTIYGMLSSIKFDVVGGDHRLRDFEIQVVERPAVELIVDCEYPEYLRNPDSDSGFQFPFPQTRTVTRSVEIARGTNVTVRASSNKPLQAAELRIGAPEDEATPAIQLAITDPYQFEFEIPALETPQLVQLDLTDTDGISSKESTRLMVEVIPDLAPVVDVRLRGIGTAVTPDVLIPLVGIIKDEYGMETAQWNLRVLANEDERATATRPFAVFRGGMLQIEYVLDDEAVWHEALDIRQLRRDEIQRRQQERDGATSNSGALFVSIQDGAQGGGVTQDDQQSSDDPQQDEQQPTEQEPTEQEPIDPGNPYQLVPGEKLILEITVMDASTLPDGPNIGRSQEFLLEVVTPERLRILLANEEINLRKRFEDQIIIEFDGSIELVAGLDFVGLEAAPRAGDPQDNSGGNPQSANFLRPQGHQTAENNFRRESVLGVFSAAGINPLATILSLPAGQQDTNQGNANLEPGERVRPTRQLTRDDLMLQTKADVREVILRSEKNGNEIIGIAEGFEDILLEFTNNRMLDSAELTRRIRDNIAIPLRQLGEEKFPRLNTLLVELRNQLDDETAYGAADWEKSATEAQVYMTEIKADMQIILSHMRQLESYEELVELMKEIIETQESIKQDTGTYRRQRLTGDDGGF